MPPDEVEATLEEPIAIQALRFISSIGHYGMIVGVLQAAYGVYQWDKIPVLIGVCGAIFSFGWKMLWDWIITKMVPSAQPTTSLTQGG